MKPNKFIVLAYLAVFTFFAPAKASDLTHAPIKMLGMAWGVTLEMDRSGLFDDLLKEILKRVKTNIKYTPAPFARAIHEFVTRRSDCIFSVSKATLADIDPSSKELDLVATKTITEQNGFLFSGKGKIVINTLEEMRGKTIGKLNGETYQDYYAKYRVNWVNAPNEKSKIKMLHFGRVDYAIGYYPDAFVMFRRLGIVTPPHNKNLVIYKSRDGITCHNNVQNRRLVAKLDNAILAMRRDGSFTRIYKNHDLNFRKLN